MLDAEPACCWMLFEADENVEPLNQKVMLVMSLSKRQPCAVVKKKELAENEIAHPDAAPTQDTPMSAAKVVPAYPSSEHAVLVPTTLNPTLGVCTFAPDIDNVPPLQDWLDWMKAADDLHVHDVSCTLELSMKPAM